jgi:hypothetical protein
MDLRTVASKVVGEMANSAVPFSGPLAESLVQELLGAQDEQIVLLRDDDVARHYAADAYTTARSAMGTLAQQDYRGRKPDKPDGVARLRASGAVYDQIELAAAVICDPRALQVLTEDGLSVYFRFDDHAEVKWAAEGPLDFVYIAYFHYLMQFVREAETRAPIRFTSLDMVWFRFFNPTQVEYPAYPPLPPMVVLEDVSVLVNDLMRLAVMGRLP